MCSGDRLRHAAPSPALLAERLGLIAQRIEIGDDVGAVLGLAQADEGHLGALGEVLRLVEPVVERVERPGLAACACAAPPRKRSRRGPRAIWLADDAVEIGADAVRAALVEGVAGGADLGLVLAGIGARPRRAAARSARARPGFAGGRPRPCWRVAGDLVDGLLEQLSASPACSAMMPETMARISATSTAAGSC